MANFQRNSLYGRSKKKVEAAARAEWNNSNPGRACNMIRSALAGNSVSGRGTPVMRAMTQWQGSGWTDPLKRLVAASDFGGMVREAEKYARRGGATARLLSDFLGSLGPVGSMIKAMVAPGSKMRRKSLSGDIQSALEFINAVAPDRLSSKGRSKAKGTKARSRKGPKAPPAPTPPSSGRPGASRTRSKTTTGGLQEQIEAAQALLVDQGYEVTSPKAIKAREALAAKEAAAAVEAAKPKYPGGISRTTKAGTPRKVIKLEINGRNQQFPVHHPMVTKGMVKTPLSSNVYSYGYDYDTMVLTVRYQQNAKVSGAPAGFSSGKPGAMYAYEGVKPEKFLAMHAASSKGGAVWDLLRVRHTFSGHQHDYRLIAVRDSYVPRKATITPGGEAFVKRFVKVQNRTSGKIRVLESGDDMMARPFRGFPDRGTPNNGRQ